MSTPADATPVPSPVPSLSRPTTPPSNLADTQNTAPSASIARLDDIFNFQIVVFEVENTLFQVLKNGFNVPGTKFEAMFAPSSTESQHSLLDSNSLQNPIPLPGIEAKHFRVFLRTLYPFISQSAVVEYEDWVGVLHLATMWKFKEIRLKAITALSVLIQQKTVFERISLARKYGVIEWLREAYVELAQKRPLKLEELRESTLFRLDWEAVARLFYIQTQLPVSNTNVRCSTCGNTYGPSYGTTACKCGFLTKVDEVFKTELANLKFVIIKPGLPYDGQPPTPVRKGKKQKGPATPSVPVVPPTSNFDDTPGWDSGNLF